MLDNYLICPKCGRQFVKRPALSRDSKELICPDCGVREALEAYGLNEEQTEHIIDDIKHAFRGIVED